ncbi:hypothetical protein [Oscillatoria sp. FACHB-1406]|nr:hypothetical protein [Oscillatoria sp. FACHB-1406]MBD2580370.1 hypothetical protein [Oscillatoria sp. FACHB-1406]
MVLEEPRPRDRSHQPRDFNGCFGWALPFLGLNLKKGHKVGTHPRNVARD